MDDLDEVTEITTQPRCRISNGIKTFGVDTVVIENEILRVSILAGRGADVFEFAYKPKNLDFTWKTSIGLSRELTPKLTSEDDFAFLKGYHGGWQSIFPNGGAPSEFEGIHYGQHDEVAILPWRSQIIEESKDCVRVQFSVHAPKSNFDLVKIFTLRSGSSTLEIEESATNLSLESKRAMWGFHFAFGPNFLEPGCKITIAGKPTVIPHEESIADTGRRLGNAEKFNWPFGNDENSSEIDFSIIPERETKSEILYLSSLASGEYKISNPRIKISVQVNWDLSIFPYLWFWQEFGSSKNAPWFGEHFNIGLEPFSSYPTNGLAKAVANGSALTFAGNETKYHKMQYQIREML